MHFLSTAGFAIKIFARDVWRTYEVIFVFSSFSRLAFSLSLAN